MIKPLPWLITMRKDTYHKRLGLEDKVKELERENQALKGRVIVLREQLAKERI